MTSLIETLKTAATIEEARACRSELEGMSKAEVAQATREAFEFTPHGTKQQMIDRLMRQAEGLVMTRQRLATIMSL